MAVSSGLRPRSDAAHWACVMLLAMAWTTGTSSRANAATDQPAAVGPSALTSPMANDVVLTSASMRPIPSSAKKPRAAGMPLASSVRSEAV